MARQKQDGLFYFPFDTDFFFADKRIKRVKARLGNNGLLFYIYLLTEIYRNGYYIGWDEESVENAIDDLNLTEGFIEQAMICLTARELITKIEITDSKQVKTAVITSPGIQKRYQEAIKSRKRDIYVDAKIWLLEEKETAAYIKVTHNDNKSCGNDNKSCGNAIKESKVKESKVKENNMCKAEASALFERLWPLYPNKKGKGQVSDSAKLKLLKIGYDEMVRAIDRYKAELEKDKDWRKPQNGSTFFNSGYIDYLDANYVPSVSTTAKKNQFNNFHQRTYDYAAMEKILLERD